MSAPEKYGTRECVALSMCAFTLLRCNALSTLEWWNCWGNQASVMQMSEILDESRLYKRNRRPIQRHSPPGYVQPTPNKTVHCLVACLNTVLSVISVWQMGTKNSFQDFNVSTFWINLTPNIYLGGLLKGIWPVTMNLILLMPKEKHHFFGIWFSQINK